MVGTLVWEMRQDSNRDEDEARCKRDDKWGKFLMMKLASLLPPWFCFNVDESQTGGVCDECDGCLTSPFSDSFGQNRLIYITWEVKIVFLGASGRTQQDQVVCCCM